ncbi:hypothetical protein G8D25_18945 [Ralstonia solanacearum]|uniref:hypothetical protein n=1 Tax=Ralstonia solanacearum TaxID=305 RepID=UPI001448FE50|nr:hypothetical protein G8D25_18945 [Ralstonia solanacearum]
MYRRFVDAAVKVPVLANLTEFGQTPLFTRDELASAGVAMVLYPLSAFRAMNKAAENVYAAIRRDGTQKAAGRHHADPHGTCTTASATTTTKTSWTRCSPQNRG